MGSARKDLSRLGIAFAAVLLLLILSTAAENGTALAEPVAGSVTSVTGHV